MDAATACQVLDGYQQEDFTFEDDGAGVVDVRSGSYSVIGVDPIQPQHVYLAYAAYQGVDEADIFFIRSLDGGANWSFSVTSPAETRASR